MVVHECYMHCMAKTDQIVARVDHDLMEQFRKAAADDDRSIASALAQAIKLWLANKGSLHQTGK